MTEIDERWGEGALADVFLGPTAEIDGVRELFGRAPRRGASPTMGKHLLAGADGDRGPRGPGFGRRTNIGLG